VQVTTVVPRFKDMGARLSNWGRWGEDDQLGTLNHLTAEHVRAAAGTVRLGQRFELSIPLAKNGPHNQQRRGVRVNPVHLMGMLPGEIELGDGVEVADDYIVMPLQAATQWDGLGHVGYDGQLYNGVPSSSITALGGATRNGIETSLPGFTGRGVLLDLPALHGLDRLPVDHAVTPDELEAVVAAQGVEVRRGDAVLVRTGWLAHGREEGWDGWLEVEPGLTLDCAEWLHEREVCTVASDNWGVEVAPFRPRDGVLALHCVLIRDLGMMLGEMWQLDELACACAADGQWDFFLSAPALRVTGAVGSPVSPVAVR
jgi:kynurenine formamidase